ncbi:MAG TPA: adenylate/guanylate cyclase domain-containing protein [Oligoflexus sp.]|uniref:adenylate/guanylate cyclase domain-containing protein n=1 Tax=Oligoflexus sp. TaxID=1971216 RepID=UPI002D80EFE3|nr:adenylate/guanylate cyclase domain-containing protein [Oligoflexus sp.]HET9241114.1 adenylate/guanylate cyclase domain-containing protein [Oligoflexus sp.]
MFKVWTYGKLKLLGALLAFWPFFAFANINDPEHVLGPYSRAERRLEKILEPMPGKGLLEKIEAYERGRKPDSDTDYILRRLKLRQYDDRGQTQDAMNICTGIKADDYEMVALCTYMNPNKFVESAIQQTEKIWEQSQRELPGTVVPTRVAIILLNMTFDATDISRAREFYQQALATLPRDALRSRLDLNWTVANVYSFSLNSEAMQRESMKLYDALEQAYQEDPESLYIAEYMAFNKGLNHIFLFQDYKAALQEFSKLPRTSRPWLDAQVYSALAYFHLKENAKARSALANIQLEKHLDLQRLPSLACYQAIVRFGLKESTDLSDCFSMLEKGSGPDTSIQLTRELMDLDLPVDARLRVLQAFWRIYLQQLEPKIRQIMENNSNAIELARVRTENLVKDYDIKNFNLLKIIAGGLIFGLLLAAFMLWNLRSKNRSIEKLQTYIQQAVLARFLPPVIVAEIVQGRSRLEAEPKDELITLMFCDIVGFTALSGDLDRPQTVALLNDFMHIVTEVVYKHGGTIDKFIGDAAMVIFGAPTPLDAKIQAERAVACAQDLLVAMSRVHHFKLRIGIHQGMATVGIFGSERRSDFTAIGSTVNIASRIEGRAQPQEILMSEAVAHHLPESAVMDCGFYELRGIMHPVRLYRSRTLAALNEAS